MAGMDWFRWHHGSVTDPKFQLVAKKSGVKPSDVIAVWACLLEEASQAEDRGHPGQIDFDALDCLLGLDDGAALRIYGRMNERGLFCDDGRVEAWERRQPKREREDDNAAERKRRQRAKETMEGTKPAVTPSHAKSRQEGQKDAASHQKTPRGEESREEYSVPNGTGEGRQGGEPEVGTPDAIFGVGLSYLTRCGVAEKSARSFLGKMRQALKDDMVAAELLTKAEQRGVSEPLAWLRKAAHNHINAGLTTTGVAL